MLSKIVSWFREECPLCRQKLVFLQAEKRSTSKHCPQGHYVLETHPVLGVQVAYHRDH